MPTTVEVLGCWAYRETPKEHRCIEGACYYGDTEETRAFGNCCMLCPKKLQCQGRCTKADEHAKEIDKDILEDSMRLSQELVKEAD